MSDLIRRHIFVSGRVQGVGYRFFVSEEAGQFGIRGWVRNLSDGRVEVEAAGMPEAMEQFVRRMEVGPGLGRVTAVVAQPSADSSPLLGFRIRSDG